ncbi:MAG: germination protein YpeB [Christensenellaceae bacterium]|jgi:germination protein YpeB|nr:germination protein YpeB [Christensenellaceae bacterium]
MKKGLLIVLILVSICTITLGILLGVNIYRKNTYQLRLNNLYSKTYYETTDLIADIELKLSKLNVSSTAKYQRTLLLDVWNKSLATQLNLSQLYISAERITPLIKFFNQLGDYSKHLANASETRNLTSEESAQLINLHKIVRSLLSALSKTSDLLNVGERFVEGIESEMTIFDNCFELISNENEPDYPQMIYDGAFSDGLLNKVPVFLSNLNLIDIDTATKIVRDKFANTKSINYLTKRAGAIESYIFDVDWEGGIGRVGISIAGGYIVEYVQLGNVTNPILSEYECMENGLKILESLGYPKMKAVWSTNINSVVYIDFAYCENEVTYYPDLIKVKISSESGHLIGLEACNYIYNHYYGREIACDIIDIAIIKNMLIANINIESENVCVIPTEAGIEKIAYEFYCSYLDSNYYVYIDAITLEEINIVKVVESEWGMLVA